MTSIVLLNWNGSKYIFDCIKSVEQQSYSNIELILVDNGSTDGSIEKIQKEHSHYKIIKHKSNIGFARGMNSGFEVANGKYIMPLNLDVFLDKEYINDAVNILEKDEKIGVVGGQEYIWENAELTNKMNLNSGALFIRKRFQIRGTKNKETQYCFGVTGSFPLMRKKMLNDIKSVSGYYYDPKFETGWEDTDLWFRMHLRGWKAYYSSDLKSWHVGSSSAKGKRLVDKSIEYQARIFRNRKYVIYKNIPNSILRWLAIPLKFTSLILYPYYLIRSPKSIKAINLAKTMFIINKESIIKERKLIQSSKLVSDNYIKTLFKGY